jgi:hypothetical protein
MHFHILSKKGAIDCIDFSSGETLTLDVETNKVFNLSAESGARVEVTNYGTTPAKISCTSMPISCPK